MYELIGPLTTRAFRVAWMLHEVGVDFAQQPLPPRDPKLAGINPSLKVPCLKDDGRVVIDSVAICQYLADKHGKCTFPAGTFERAEQDSFTQFAVDELEGPLWITAKHTFTFLLPEEYRIADVKRACGYDYERALKVLSQRLGDRTYLMGDTFTVPDVIAGFCLMWGGKMGWPVPDGNVKQYVERLQARPAWIKAAALRDSQAAAAA